MAIKVMCKNGHALTAKDSLAGEKVACPKCGSPVQIPHPTTPTSANSLDQLQNPLDAPPDPINPHDPFGSVDPFGSQDPFGGAADLFSNLDLVDLTTNAATTPQLNQLNAGDYSISAAAVTQQQRPTVAAGARPNHSNSTKLWIIVGISSGLLFVSLVAVCGIVLLVNLGGRFRKAIEEQAIYERMAIEKEMNGQADNSDLANRDEKSGNILRGRASYTFMPAVWTTLEKRDIAPNVTSGTVEEFQEFITPLPIAVDNKSVPPLFETANIRAMRDAKPGGVAKTSIAQAKKSSNLIELTLPSLAWRAAYDPVSGGLIVSNDHHGFLQYSINSLAAKNAVPVRKFEIKGQPSAVCLKPRSAGNTFIFTGSDEDVLYVVEAATGKPISRLQLELASSVLQLVSSSDPLDPFVYLLSSVRGGVERPGVGILGRINVATGEQEYHKDSTYNYLEVSRDGKRIYVAKDSTVVSGSWQAFAGFKQWTFSPAGSLDAVINLSARDRKTIPVRLNQQVGMGSNIFDQSGTYALHDTPFIVLAGFDQLPTVLGWREDGSLCFASALDQYVAESIEVPSFATNTEDRVAEDFRSVGLRRLMPGKMVTHAFCDDQRALSLVIADQSLAIARLNKKLWSGEENLSSPIDLPSVAYPGQALSLPVAGEKKVVEIIRLTAQQDNYSRKNLGHVFATKLAKMPLRVGTRISPEDQSFTFKNAKITLTKGDTIRIENEIMTVMDVQAPIVKVKRPRPAQHSPGAYVEPLNKLGSSTIDLTLQPQGTVSGKRLVLSAQINPTQEKIFVNDLAPLAGMTLPVTIQIENEKMQVLEVESFSDSLKVERSSPSPHSVNAPVNILPDIEMDAPVDDIPIIEDGVLHWTPSAHQIGQQFLRLRVTQNGICKEEVHPIIVARPHLPLNEFQVVGLEIDSANPNLAVVWGTSQVPRAIKDLELNGKPAADTTAYLGIFDLQTNRLIRSLSMPRHVLSAAMHDSTVYACLSPFSEKKIEPHTDVQMLQAKIYVLSANNLEIQNFVNVDAACSKLQVIVGKYLGALGINGITYGFRLPDLRPDSPQWSKEPMQTFGRLGEGWVWDGVLYDRNFLQPKLLISAHAFRTINLRMDSKCGFMTTVNLQAPKIVQPKCDGYDSGEYLPDIVSLPGPRVSALRLRSVPVKVMLGGQVAFASATNSVANVIWEDTAMPCGFFVPIDSPTPVLGNFGLSGNPNDRWLTEQNERLYIADGGRVVEMSVDEFLPACRNSAGFRMTHEQDTFTLSVDKKNVVRYSAPGATKYTLVLHHAYNSEDQALLIEHPEVSPMRGFEIMTSENGEFEISFSEEAFADLAIRLLGSNHGELPFEELVSEHLAQIAEPYRRLTGKLPTHIPVPYYAVVYAEHPDLPTMHALMAHAYLVEVPVDLAKASLPAR